MADSDLWAAVWSAYNLNNNASQAAAAGGGTGGSQQQHQPQRGATAAVAPNAAPPPQVSVSALSLEGYDELVLALTRGDDGGTPTEGAPPSSGQQHPLLLPRRRCRRVSNALDAAALPLSSLRALLSLHGCTAGNKASKGDVLDRLAGCRVRLPEVVSVSAAPAAAVGGEKSVTPPTTTAAATGVTSADLAALGWASPGPELDAALLASPFDEEGEGEEAGVGEERREACPPPAPLAPAPAADVDADAVPPPSKRARSEEEGAEVGGGREEEEKSRGREEEEQEEETEVEERAKQERQRPRHERQLKLRAGTLVWAPVGAAFWPAEVAEDFSFPRPSPSPPARSASTALVGVRILGLSSLKPLVPLGSLRPIAEEFERRAREVSSAAGQAGATAVRIAEERVRASAKGEGRGGEGGGGEGGGGEGTTAMEQ